jgi:hypothetical protein
LIWLLEGSKVVALTADTATIKNRTTGAAYRRHRNVPAPTIRAFIPTEHRF